MNDNKELAWKSEMEMRQELTKAISEWVDGKSKDGYVLAAEGKFFYKGIAYLIKVLRYYNHTNRFVPLGSNRISEYHAVVEYPEETAEIVNAIPDDLRSEFLYHDTLHLHNDKQTVEEQVEECHRMAERDIDDFLNGELSKQINDRIGQLQTLKAKIEKLEGGGLK